MTFTIILFVITAIVIPSLFFTLLTILFAFLLRRFARLKFGWIMALNAVLYVTISYAILYAVILTASKIQLESTAPSVSFMSILWTLVFSFIGSRIGVWLADKPTLTDPQALAKRMKRKKIVSVVLIALSFLIVVLIGYHLVNSVNARARIKELCQQLEQNISAWEKKEYSRSLLYGEPIPGNAAEFYAEAEAKIEDCGGGLMAELGDAINDPTKPLTSTVLAYYERNKSIIDLVRKGSRAETLKPLIDLRKGFEAPIPNLLKARALAQIMVFQGRDLEKAGQISGAVKLYCDIVRFGDAYVLGGPLISAMVGVAVSEIGYQEIQRLLLDRKPGEPHLGELIKYLEILCSDEPSLQNTYEAEKLCLGATLKPIAEVSADAMFTMPEPINTWCVNGWDDITRFMEECERINTLPLDIAEVENDKLTDKVRATKNPFTLLMTPSLFGSHIANLELQSLRRGIYILAALKLYQLKHQFYPDSLSDLAPEIIPEVPLDPFSNQPFIYRIDQDQTLFFYSVGPNLTDDGGDEEDHKDIVISPTNTQKEE